ncbi:MAG TPA: hypothetical protein VFI31_00420 [Pirellulales bacterium]|nr:hypothetical protein [Pirellulales bacterium]
MTEQLNFSDASAVGERLGTLTLRASVAYALRTAWRVLPLVEFARNGRSGLPDKTAYDQALALPAAFATGRPFNGVDRRSDVQSQIAIIRQYAENVTIEQPKACSGSCKELAEIGTMAAYSLYGASRAGAGALSAMLAGSTDDGLGDETLKRAAEAVAFGFRAATAASASDSALAKLTDYPNLSACRRQGEAEWIKAAFSFDLDRLYELRRGDWREWGHPLDPSESGPLGELWPDGTPAWFVAGQRRLTGCRALTLEPVPNVGLEELKKHAQETFFDSGVDCLVFDLKRYCGNADNVCQAIERTRNIYREVSQPLPCLAIIGARVSDDDFKKLTTAGAVAFGHADADHTLYCETLDDLRLLLDRNELPLVGVESLSPTANQSTESRPASEMVPEEDRVSASAEDYKTVVTALKSWQCD